MQAGVTDHLWDVADFVSSWEAEERKCATAASQDSLEGKLAGRLRSFC